MSRQARWMRWGLLACVAAVVLVVFVFVPGGKAFMAPPPKEPVPERPRVELAQGELETLRVPEDVARTMGLQTETVRHAPPPSPLKLEGSLFLDPNRLTHVHTRFAGEVVEIGNIMGNPDAPDAQSGQVSRPIRFGDRVTKGQLLAIVWSKDLGEKKSELIDAISRLTLDQETAKRLEKLYRDGNVPERSLREMERQVESDLIAVAKAERTLRAWRLTNEDIDEIRAEAKRIHDRQGHVEPDVKEAWARVEVRAAIDGVVVEKNIAKGDVVDTALDLFKIADLTRLDVLAHAYEEDVRLLEDLPRPQRQWKISLKSDPNGKPLSGSFDQIGSIIDPNQHTALVMGWVDNRDGRLRVGQFVTARVELPADPDEVAIPVGALIDQGGETFVLVRRPKASDAKDEFVSRRKVWLTRRCEQQVYISVKLTDAQRQAGLSELHAGEEVVTSGCVELAAALDDLAVSAQLAHK
jgi:cobalt-zinc-cadmium efflux system membrane fusion protein